VVDALSSETAPTTTRKITLTTHIPASRSRAKRFLLRALGIVLAPVAGVALMVAPASAEQRCSGQPEVNVCLSITRLSNGEYAVRIGIDYRVSLSVAQQIIASGGISAAVWGDDWDDDIEFRVPRITWGASAESGLSADFDRVVPGHMLDEDPVAGDRDELYGKVTVRLPNNTLRTFQSPNINGHFS
jgi:hypothetical protein